MYCHLFVITEYYNADDATMWALRQAFVQTPAVKIAVDLSVKQQITNFTFVIKSTNACFRRFCDQ
jgi:hypothetical protein